MSWDEAEVGMALDVREGAGSDLAHEKPAALS
jgi:hypothetical protein